MRNDRFYDRGRFSKKKRDKKSKKSDYFNPYYKEYSLTNLLSDVGNQEIANFFESGLVQAKLNISQPDDIFEKEADKIAKDIVDKNTTETPKISSVQKGPNAKNTYVNNETESKIKNLKGKGRPLYKSVKDYFQPRFGIDLGNVRVHTGNEANRLANSLNAKAFTYGNDIVFGQGQFQPGTTKGKELIAHELTHTMQQGGGVQRDVVQRKEPNYSTKNFRYTELSGADMYGAKVNISEAIDFYKRNKNFREQVYNQAKANGETSEISPYSGRHIGTIALFAGEGHPDSEYSGVRDVYESTCQIEYIQLFDRNEQQWINFFNGNYNSIKAWEIQAYMAVGIGNINLLASDFVNNQALNEQPTSVEPYYQVFDYLDYVHYIKEPASDINAGSKVFLKAMLMSKNLQLAGGISLLESDGIYRHSLHTELSFLDIFPAFCDKYLYDVIKDLSLEELRQIEIDSFLKESHSAEGFLKIIDACIKDLPNRLEKIVVISKGYTDLPGKKDPSPHDKAIRNQVNIITDEASELGLLIGPCIKIIKKIGMDKLDLIADASTLAVSLVAIAIGGLSVVTGGVLPGVVSSFIGYIIDYVSETDFIQNSFLKEANEKLSSSIPTNTSDEIEQIIENWDGNNNAATYFAVKSALKGFIGGIYQGLGGYRPKP